MVTTGNMMSKKKFPVGYSASSGPHYESEGSGSSGRTDDYSAPMRKLVDLNTASKNGFAVPIQSITLSKLSTFERTNLAHRLTSELDQIRILQRKLESQKTKFISSGALSSSGDIRGSNNVRHKGQVCSMKKLSGAGSVGGKKARGWNRGTTGRFQSNMNQHVQHVRVDPNAGLLKQCDALLKKLMSHQYGWVFNTPVDVVALNIPDYLNIIKNPMDLGTIKSKLSSGRYTSPLDFLADVRLTFSNAKTYNAPGSDVYIMADTLSTFFELRWKPIDKKLVVSRPELLPEKSRVHEENGTAEPMVDSKKRKLSPTQHEAAEEPNKRRVTDEEKHKLSRELEDMGADMPYNIVEFLKAQSSDAGGAEDEIEIDIDVLSDDTLLTLRKLLDDHKKENLPKSEVCEIELPNVPGLSNSSLQVDGENDPDDDDIDIGGNEPPVTSCPPIVIDKDATEGDEKCIEAASVSGLDQLEQSSHLKNYSSDSDGHQAEKSEQAERPVSPDKQYRAAQLKKRFLDTILKAQEKTLQEDKGDPEKLRREREELEMHKKREKARLQAEAKAAEDARKRAEAEAAEEAKKKRELEREAAREALLKIEKTVEINETSRFLEDLEMLRAVPSEQLPNSADETSPDPSQDGFGNLGFGGGNPLEQLGLFMKEDDEEEEGEQPPSVPNAVDDIEEGQID